MCEACSPVVADVGAVHHCLPRASAHCARVAQARCCAVMAAAALESCLSGACACACEACYPATLLRQARYSGSCGTASAPSALVRSYPYACACAAVLLQLWGLICDLKQSYSKPTFGVVGPSCVGLCRCTSLAPSLSVDGFERVHAQMMQQMMQQRMHCHRSSKRSEWPISAAHVAMQEGQ